MTGQEQIKTEKAIKAERDKQEMTENEPERTKNGPEQTKNESIPAKEPCRQTGRVWLVGAGPGAPDLITKRGHDLLQRADVVVYDALILPETLEMIPQGVEKIYVGKRAGAHSVPQEEIQEILIREAGKGKQVVRLKGGDPFVFGRGGEEALALAKCGIPCEIVPGVSSAVAVPEAFGIPVTHRGLASSFTVITGHSSKDFQIDYEALVRTGGTLVFLMGLSAAQRICLGLVEAGMDPSVPAAALSKGTTPAQRMVLSTVGRLAEDIRSAELEAPVILVVGEVCALAPALGHAGVVAEEDVPGKVCPLAPVPGRAGRAADEDVPGKVCPLTPALGRAGVAAEEDVPEKVCAFAPEPDLQKAEDDRITVVVTRQEEKAGAFSARLRAMGFHVLELPAIRIRKPEGDGREKIMSVLRGLCGEEIDWLIFTSANGVNVFFELLGDAGLDMRQLLCGGQKKFAAVGPKTAEALKEHGILADLVPEEHTGAALGEALRGRTEQDKAEKISKYPGYAESREKEYPPCGRQERFWFFGAARTGGGLEAALAAEGIPLTSVPVYETVSAVSRTDAEKLADRIAQGNERFLFTFTSASCVKNLAAAMAETEILSGQTAVCIGEKTAKAAREIDMRVVVSKESTEESMLEAVCGALNILSDQ